MINGLPYFSSPYVIALLLIDLTLKGFAMWKAAKNNQRNWFIALLIINTAGILPIIYITFFGKQRRLR